MILNLLNTFNNKDPKINVDSYMIIEKLTNMDNKALNQYDNHLNINTHNTIATNKSKKAFPIKMNKISKKFVNQMLLKDKAHNKNFKVNTDNNLNENNKLFLINNTLNNNSLNYIYSQTNENAVTKKENYNKPKSLNKYKSIQSIKLKGNNTRYSIEKKYRLVLQEKNNLISKLKNEVEYYKNYWNNNINLNKVNTLNSLDVFKTNNNNQFNTIETANNKKNYFLSSSKNNNVHYLGLNSSSVDSSSSKNIFGLNKSNDLEIVAGNNIISYINDNYYLNNKNDKKIILKGNDLIKSQINIFKKYNRFITDNILNNEKKYKLNLRQNNVTIDIAKNYMYSPIKINNNRNKIKFDSLDLMANNNSVSSPKRILCSLNTTSSDEENLVNRSVGNKIIYDDIFQQTKMKMEKIKNRMDNLCKNLFATIENNNKDNRDCKNRTTNK